MPRERRLVPPLLAALGLAVGLRLFALPDPPGWVDASLGAAVLAFVVGLEVLRLQGARAMTASVAPAIPRRTRIGLWGLTAALLAGGLTSVYVRQPAKVLSVDEAVRRFQQESAAPSPSRAPEIGSTAVVAPDDEPATVAEAGGPTPSPAATASGDTQAKPVTGQPHTTGNSPKQAAPPPVVRPEDGVYVYATDGHGRTNALGGASHDYPDETTVTFRSTACGWQQRWQPLQERWDESEGCSTASGFEMRRVSLYHEFFQRGQRQDFVCPPGSFVLRTGSKAGESWTMQCASSNATVGGTVTHVADEVLRIDGRDVAVVRMRYDFELGGANRGTQVQERWIGRSNGLLVRMKTDVTTESESPFGTVAYEEHYTLQLRSLAPRR